MKAIAVDMARCMGHGQCYGRAPELMQPLDDFGHAQFVAQPIDPSDDAMLRRAEETVRNCPEQALSMVDVDE